MDKIQVIILAAGQGKRMGSADLPKVLIPLKGQPMISYLLKAIAESGVCNRPAIVVGAKADQIKETLGDKYIYIFQKEQLGTGHAVAASQPELEGKAEHIMIFYGDHPLISSGLIKNLASTHLAEDNVLTMVTTSVPDFDGWRSEFSSFAKIIRDDNNQVVKIIEKKDLSKEQEDVKEVNPGYYCFKAEWLWSHLDKLKNDNAQREYYLTDLVLMVTTEGHQIKTVSSEPKEALGINTPEQLEEIEKLL